MYSKLKQKPKYRPLQNIDEHGIAHIVYNDIDKVESLNNYFASISCLVGGEPALPEFSLLCTDVLDKIEIIEQDIKSAGQLSNWT